MNDNWPIAKIGDCASLVRHTLGPDACNGEKYIGLEHIGEGSLTITSTGDGTLVQSAKSKFQAGDALFGKLRSYFRKVAIAPFDGVCSTDIWVIRAKTGTDQRFLFYRLASQEFIDAATRGSEGTKMPRAKWEFVSRFAFPLPPLPIQKRIAHILGTLDDKIELNRRMNETLEAMARAIFKSWFIDFDPVKRNMERNQPSPGLRPPSPTGRGAGGEGADALFPSEFQNSELGLIPKGWSTIPLYETAEFINGAAFKDAHFSTPENGLPVIKIGELKQGVTEQTKFSDRTDLDQKYEIGCGDVLFSWSGSPDTSIDTFLWTGGLGILNQHIFRVRTASDSQRIFVYHLLKHLGPTLIEIARDKQTTGLGHVTVADMRRLQVASPPSAVLTAFGMKISATFERGFEAKMESERLAKLRDVLLPKLLSGELQVKLTEAPGK